MIERFFRSFKEECVWQKAFETFDEAYDRIALWMEHYNRERPHSALGYATPEEVRRKLVAWVVRKRGEHFTGAYRYAGRSYRYIVSPGPWGIFRCLQSRDKAGA